MNRRGNFWEGLPHEHFAPMVRFFRGLKPESVPQIGFTSFTEAKASTSDYITGYYSQVRPHHHDDGLAPNVAERNYRIEYKAAAKSA